MYKASSKSLVKDQSSNSSFLCIRTNNFAPFYSWSLCEFVGDCLGPQYISSQKIPWSETITLISHKDFKKDGAQLLLSKQFSPSNFILIHIIHISLDLFQYFKW